jgi:hypothetical protein
MDPSRRCTVIPPTLVLLMSGSALGVVLIGTRRPRRHSRTYYPAIAQVQPPRQQVTRWHVGLLAGLASIAGTFAWLLWVLERVP